MARQFISGRQNEILMNEDHYKIFKVMEHFLSEPDSQNPSNPNIKTSNENNDIGEKALWIDNFTDPNSADLKFYNGVTWDMLFKNRFKITQHLLDEEEPKDPLESQLWIDKGTMKYYHNGQFNPIKAVPYDVENVNPIGFEDFLIVSPLVANKDKIVDNFTEFIFKKPVLMWKKGYNYSVDEGCIFDLHVYKCIASHTSSDTLDPTDKRYWVRLNYLNQYLIPNSYQDRFFIDGEFIHQKLGWVLKDNTSDPKDDGYEVVTNVCVNFPVEMVNAKTASCVHVNPKKLNNIEKKFIKIDKANPIIEVPEENTEFYGIQGGIGRFLIKTDNKNTTDYISVTSNNTDCIKLSNNVAKRYDYIYAIHYEFVDCRIKQPGILNKKKIKLQDENYVWIGDVNSDQMLVFAQGLYYAECESNYRYDSESGYLYINEKLQDYDNLVKTFDFSVLTFPKVYKGVVDDNFGPNGYRINLTEPPKSDNLIAFVEGVQLNGEEEGGSTKKPQHLTGVEVKMDENDHRILYIPSLTADVYDNLDKHTEEIHWAIAEVEKFQNNDKNEPVEFDMWRGRCKAVNKDPYGVVIPIYRDKTKPAKGAVYFEEDDNPIVFVDGVLVFQKEIEVYNDYLWIYGLREGQEIVVLGDKKSNQQTEFENSDNLIFEDQVSYATIPIPTSDNVLVYVENGILCDASAVYTSIKPIDPGYHGEIRYWVNYSQSQWLMYDEFKMEWVEIDPSEIVTDEFTGKKTFYTDLLDRNSRGYSATRNSISFLQNLGDKVCTYYAYKYCDSIEKPLEMDYCYPDGKTGINNEDEAFKINYRHSYTPGKNELTIYLNGIRQNLDSPYNIVYPNSKNKECKTYRNDSFIFAFDDGTKEGKAIPAESGYYRYYLRKSGEYNKTISVEKELTDAQKQAYIDDGWKIKQLSSPNKNIIFYVIEHCESGETTACERKTLTYKDALASKGAFTNCAYDTGDFLLTRGNIRVFINGIRQPNGYYQTWKAQKENSRKSLEAYRVIDSKTIEIKDPIIGGLGGNEGNLNNPLFPNGYIILPNGEKKYNYYNVIDEIVIETRRDFKLREITIPIKDNTGEFTVNDGLPADLFKTKDKIMIYINGLAYGKDYKIENGTLKLLNESVKNQLGCNDTDVITFEWR